MMMVLVVMLVMVGVAVLVLVEAGVLAVEESVGQGVESMNLTATLLAVLGGR